MKKFWRFIASGKLLIIVALAIEVGFLIFFTFFVDEVIDLFVQSGLGSLVEDPNVLSLIGVGIYILFRLAIFIFELVVFFVIVNRQEDPEFKIPWIVGMLLFPFLVAVMFLIFGRHKLRKKDQVIIKATKNAYNAHFDVEHQKEEMGRAYGAFKYLNSTTLVGAHQNNRVTYYKNGEEFFPAFIEDLKQAKEFIFIEFFIITDGKEWSAVKEVLKQKA